MEVHPSLKMPGIFAGRTRNNLLHAIAGGWQLTGILSLQTGPPFTVLSGRDESNTGNTGVGSDRPNIIGDWRIPNPGPDRWFNTCTLLANGAQRNCLPGDTPAWQIKRWSEELRSGAVPRVPYHGEGFAAVPLGILQSCQSPEFRATDPERGRQLFCDDLPSGFPVADRRPAPDSVRR